jgi:hypothetical protein
MHDLEVMRDLNTQNCINGFTPDPVDSAQMNGWR